MKNEAKNDEAETENADNSNAESLKSKAVTELLELVKKGIEELVSNDFESRAIETLSHAVMINSRLI